MKIACLAESPADEAALAILAGAVLGKPIHLITSVRLRHRGWPAVKDILPSVIKHLHFHSNADGLVVIVDSNGSSIHSGSHENSPDPDCRLCQLKGIVAEVQAQIKPRSSQSPLKTALGIAVPAIEAWLLCGIDSHVNEAAWGNGLKTNQMPYSKENLKEKLYGTSRPSLQMETEKMVAAANRLVNEIDSLKKWFPEGFGNLHRDLSDW